MHALRWWTRLIVIAAALGAYRAVSVHAAVVPPTGLSAGFTAPTDTPGASTYFATQPTWVREDGSAATRGWTIVPANTSLELRAAVNKGFWDLVTVATLGISAQKGDEPVQSFQGGWTKESPTAALANQYGLSYLTGFKDPLKLIVDNDDIRYGVVAPAVGVPTWFTYQPRVTLAIGWSTRTIYGQLARLLVLPRTYAPQLTATPRVLFPGQSAVVGIAGLTPSVVPDYLLSTAQYLQASPSGNQLRVTSNAVVGSTAIQSTMQFAPMFGGAAPIVSQPPPVQVYSGRLANQQVYTGQAATFRLQLPPGLVAENVEWYVGGKRQPGNATAELVVPDVAANTEVYALADFHDAGQLVASRVQTNTAQLTVLPARTDYQLAFDQPFLFATVGAASPLGRTDTLQAKVVDLPSQVPITWRMMVPDSQQATSIAQVDATGRVSATATAGSVDVVATFTVDGVLQQATKRLTIVKLANVSVVAGNPAQLLAPAIASLWPTGTQVSYSWYVAGSNLTIAPTPVATSPAAAYSLASVSSAQDQHPYQLVIRGTSAGQTQTVVSNVALLEVVPPPGLTLQVVPNFNFTAANLQPPTVAQVITGAGQLTNATGVRQLVVSDGRAQGAPWQLTVRMSAFVSIRSLEPLSTEAGAATLNLQLSDATQTTDVAVQAGGAAAVVSAANSAKVAVWDVVGTLGLKPMQAPEAGGYGAQLDWTLTAAPSALAP